MCSVNKSGLGDNYKTTGTICLFKSFVEEEFYYLETEEVMRKKTNLNFALVLPIFPSPFFVEQDTK